ncbi:MAG: hypothetical protein WDZ59_13070 [Pirellulales bacterium]
MKSTRRHELQTNELADRLGHALDRMKPYSKAMAGVFVAGIVIVAVAMFVSYRNRQREAAAWDAYTLAVGTVTVDFEALRSVAENHPETTAAQWASLAWADARLQIGIEQLFLDRASARQMLQQAREMYLQLIDASVLEEVRQRASFGLARAYEASGDLVKAREQYLAVQGGLAPVAQQRAETLQQRKVKEFYDWFAQADLPSRAMQGAPGTPGARPPFDLGDFGGLDPGLLGPTIGNDAAGQGEATGGTGTDLPSTDFLAPPSGDETAPAQPAAPAATQPAAPAGENGATEGGTEATESGAETTEQSPAAPQDQPAAPQGQ